MSMLSNNTTIGGKKPLLPSNEYIDNGPSKEKLGIVYENVTGSVNLNDYRQEGNYTFSNLTSTSNFPSGTWTGSSNCSHLTVQRFKDSTHCVQIITKQGTYQMYIRYSNSSTSWGSWQKIWNQNTDGSGTGLDADTLDGLQSTALVKVNNVKTDFNSCTEPGLYRLYSASNSPTGNTGYWGCLTICTDGSNTMTQWLNQIAFQDNQTTAKMWIRTRVSSSSWNAWHQLWAGQDITKYLLTSNLMTELKKVDGSGTGLDADLLDGKHATDFVTSNKISSTTNIDNLQTDGFYNLGSSYINSAKSQPTFTHAPGNSVGSNRGLIVKSTKGTSGNNCCTQMLFADGSNDIFVRTYCGGDWSDWSKLATSDDISDIVTGGNIIETLKTENYPFKVIEGGTEANPLILLGDNNSIYTSWPQYPETVYVKDAYIKLATNNDVIHLRGEFLYLYETTVETDDPNVVILQSQSPHLMILSRNVEITGTYHYTNNEFVPYEFTSINARRLINRSGKEFAFSELDTIAKFADIPLNVGMYTVSANPTDAPVTYTDSLWYATVYRTDYDTFRMIAYCTDVNRMYTQSSDSRQWLNDWVLLDSAGSDAATLNGKTENDFFNVKTPNNTHVDTFAEAIEEGIYRVGGQSTSPADAPYTSCFDWSCLVLKLKGAGEIYQVAFEECNTVQSSVSGTGKTYGTNAPIMYIRYNSGSAWGPWAVLWNSTVQGTGSGMDSDKLDGKEATSFVWNDSTSYTSISSLPSQTGIYRVTTSEISGTSSTFAVTKFYYSSSAYTLQASDCTNGLMYFGSRSGSTITWKKVGAGIEVLTADPSNASTGDIWIRSDLS